MSSLIQFFILLAGVAVGWYTSTPLRMGEKYWEYTIAYVVAYFLLPYLLQLIGVASFSFEGVFYSDIVKAVVVGALVRQVVGVVR